MNDYLLASTAFIFANAITFSLRQLQALRDWERPRILCGLVGDLIVIACHLFNFTGLVWLVYWVFETQGFAMLILYFFGSAFAWLLLQNAFTKIFGSNFIACAPTIVLWTATIGFAALNYVSFSRWH